MGPLRWREKEQQRTAERVPVTAVPTGCRGAADEHGLDRERTEGRLKCASLSPWS